MLATNEKAWLFHRGKWTTIKNPLYGKEAPDGNDRRSSLQEYRRKWWRIGPTFLYPNYSGILIYTLSLRWQRGFPRISSLDRGRGPQCDNLREGFPRPFRSSCPACASCIHWYLCRYLSAESGERISYGDRHTYFAEAQ
jgi:hypothetical protein